MLADQGAGAHALLDLGARHARVQQLRTRHDTVGRTGDTRQFLLRCPAVGSHYDP
jgi:hypothetical protein